MILLRLIIALTVGIIAYFGIKDMRKNMDKLDESTTAQSDAEVWYDLAH